MIFKRFISSTLCLVCFICLTVHAQQQDTGLPASSIIDKDSAYYEALRDSAIMYYHRNSLDSARQLLEIYYPYNSMDSVAVNILTDVFLKQLNKEQKGEVNFNQVNVWIKNYPFVAKSSKFRKIKTIESLRLGMAAFDKGNFVLAENHYAIIHKELEIYANKPEILALPNLHTLIFNLALKRFYDKDYKRSAALFKQGKDYYPNDPEMASMYEKAKEKIAK